MTFGLTESMADAILCLARHDGLVAEWMFEKHTRMRLRRTLFEIESQDFAYNHPTCHTHTVEDVEVDHMHGCLRIICTGIRFEIPIVEVEE